MLMNACSIALFGFSNGIKVSDMNWSHLMVLDACRYDIFRRVYREFFPDGKVLCVKSKTASTMEFVRGLLSLDEQKLKEIIYVSANPMVDLTLGEKRALFFKYVPTWRKAWNNHLNTVLPKSVYYDALKTFLHYPTKRMIIHFLQPHFPFVDNKYFYLNEICESIMSRAKKEAEKGSRQGILANLKVAAGIVKAALSKGYICAGIPQELCEFIRARPEEVRQAYTSNLRQVLFYVKKLAQILPGKIVVTADHGEAFGEKLSRILPIRVYGHPSRIRIDALTKVMYLEIDNRFKSLENAMQQALKEITKHNISKLKNKPMVVKSIN